MKQPRRPWQLWSIPAVYAPLVPWFLWQMLLSRFRHGIGFAGVLRCAPPMGAEGYWEFRKARIYSIFAGSRFTIPTVLTRPPHPTGVELERLLREQGLTFPLVAKPNLGTMSMGVRILTTQPELDSFLTRRPIDLVLQPYISDPHEFAIFYYRMPNQQHGHILDLTERVLPEVVGDGVRSIEALVGERRDWIGLASAILAGYKGDANAVPAHGERIRLAPAASGSRGATFRDSRHLKSDDLRKAMDEVAVAAGFLFGKFDIKVPSLEALTRGEGIKILEVNPVGAEINYIYDRKWRYLPALAEIRRQYRIALSIAISISTDLPKGFVTPRFTDMVRGTVGLQRACKEIAKLERADRA